MQSIIIIIIIIIITTTTIIIIIISGSSTTELANKTLTWRFLDYLMTIIELWCLYSIH